MSKGALEGGGIKEALDSNGDAQLDPSHTVGEPGEATMGSKGLTVAEGLDMFAS